MKVRKKNNRMSILQHNTFLKSATTEYAFGCVAPMPQGVFGAWANRHKHSATTEWNSVESLPNVVNVDNRSGARGGSANNQSLSGCQALVTHFLEL